jgi:predicted nucleotidyltransferase
MYGLKQIEMDKIQVVISKHPSVEKVIIYGSRAKGNNRPNSDIDFALVGNNINLSEQFNIENQLDDLLLPYKIDVAIYHKITNTDLIEHIDRRGKIFYKKSDVQTKYKRKLIYKCSFGYLIIFSVTILVQKYFAGAGKGRVGQIGHYAKRSWEDIFSLHSILILFFGALLICYPLFYIYIKEYKNSKAGSIL